MATKISEAWIARRARRLVSLREAMVAGAAVYARILGELATGAAELQASIASAEAARPNAKQLPLAIDAGPPVVMAPAPWKPTPLALSILRRIYGTPAPGVPFVGASERRGLWALREHGLVQPEPMRPGAESLTEAGLALVLAELAKS